jgi:hypothetical protein
MKGSEISQAFFREWGLPFLKTEYPELVEHLAVGRMMGSDILGADDEWSRDHDWGPCFEVWLTTQDFAHMGRRFRTAINKATPETFRGFRHHFFGRKKDPIGVTSIDRFFKEHAGCARPPVRVRDWFRKRGGERDSLVERESWLYFIKHGVVFHDPLGEFSARREVFSRYPRDVWHKLVADLCNDLWHLGEYKFCHRLVHRKEPNTIQICLGRFVETAMHLCFLLNDDYAPHWCWLAHEFAELPESDVLNPQFKKLRESRDLVAQSQIILQITSFLRKRLLEEGLIEAERASSVHDLTDAAKVIKEKIEDKWIRDVW